MQERTKKLIKFSPKLNLSSRKFNFITLGFISKVNSWEFMIRLKRFNKRALFNFFIKFNI